MPPRTPPRQLRKEILEVFKRQPNKPLNHKQVTSTLGIFEPHAAQNHDGLGGNGARWPMESLGRGKFILAEVPQNDRPVGTIQITRHGRGFVMMPDGNEISIPKGYTGTAFWGDTVEVDWVRRGRRHTPRSGSYRRTRPPTIRRRHRARPGLCVWLPIGPTPACQLFHRRP